MLLSSTGSVVEKYIQLPGGVLLTIRPAQTGAAGNTFSLPNLHGDTLATTDATGTLLSTHTYDPFGNKTGTTTPANTATGSTYAWLGQHQKETETAFTLTPIQMGARVYLPTLGRFLQTDPIEGGTLNNYVYALDPVNQFDLDGMSIKDFFGWWGDKAKEFAAGVYNAPIFGLANYVDAGRAAVSPDSSWADRGWGVLMLTPMGRVGKGAQLFSMSAHAAQRAAQRGVTHDMINQTVLNGIKLKYAHEGFNKTGFYNQVSKLFVSTYRGKILTVINNTDRQYIENLMRSKR